MRDAPRLDHIPEQTEIGQIESHNTAFAKYEAKIITMAIAYGLGNDNLSFDAKSGPPLKKGRVSSRLQQAAGLARKRKIKFG
jgi:hypothetical protein